MNPAEAKELIFIGMMTLSGGLFSIGGTGFKWARRYVLPSVNFLGLFALGVPWYFALCAMGMLCLFLHLGYGKSKSWGEKIAVMVSYVLPSLLVGWTWWLLFTPVILIALFIASNTKRLENHVVWKCVEFIFGTMIAVTLIGAYHNTWF